MVFVSFNNLIFPVDGEVCYRTPRYAIEPPTNHYVLHESERPPGRMEQKFLRHATTQEIHGAMTMAYSHPVIRFRPSKGNIRWYVFSHARQHSEARVCKNDKQVGRSVLLVPRNFNSNHALQYLLYRSEFHYFLRLMGKATSPAPDRLVVDEIPDFPVRAPGVYHLF